MNSLSRALCGSAALCVLGWVLSASAVAQEVLPAEPLAEGAGAPPGHAGFVWALGATVSNSASYAGSDRRSTGVGHVVGVALGRYTLSSGGGGSLLDRDLDKAESGLSARLVDRGKFRLTGTVRFGGGREGGDEPRLRGLPEIRRTLRARLGVVYDANKQWSFRSAINQDLLGRAGGTVLNNTARYELDLLPGTELTLLAGFQLADGTYMRSFFGVPAHLSGVSTPLPAFRPRAGMHSTELGLDWRHDLYRHWVVMGGLRYSQLRGDARQSPLTIKPDNYSVSVGLAYRY